MMGTVAYCPPEQISPGPMRSALGRLLGRCRALRAAHWAGAIRGKLADGHCLPARARSGARPVVPHGHRSHRARRDRRASDQQRSSEPTGRRERVPLRAAPDPLHARPARRSDPPAAASRPAALTSQHRRNGAPRRMARPAMWWPRCFPLTGSASTPAATTPPSPGRRTDQRQQREAATERGARLPGAQVRRREKPGTPHSERPPAAPPEHAHRYARHPLARTACRCRCLVVGVRSVCHGAERVGRVALSGAAGAASRWLRPERVDERTQRDRRQGTRSSAPCRRRDRS